MPGLGGYTGIVLAVAATIWVLSVASGVLQPLVIALFVWLLLNVTARAVQRLLVRTGVESTRIAKAVSALLIVRAVIWFGLLLSQSAATLAAQLPVYEERLDGILAALAERASIDQALNVRSLLGRIEVAPAVLNVAGSAAGFVSSLIIVIIYIAFINQEAGAAEAKLAALLSSPAKREGAVRLTKRIFADIETYIGVKVVIGLTQAVPTWIVLTLLGVDAAVFWAVLIFLVSFIPTIGTLIGIAFPALMTLVQFETLGPFFITIAVLLPVQLAATNFLEPAMMSKSLNLSPLVVFFGIFAGGAVWGITGALVIVPILSMAAMVFAHIPSLRWAAIMLSSDGSLAVVESGDEGRG
jgi:predicted PurR-regulated permease PerM